MIEQAYAILFGATLVMLSIAVVATLIRSITGKISVDRFIGINMLTTVIVIAICILSLLFDESYLTDVALIYVILGFLTIMLLCRIYINLFIKKGGKK